MNTSVVRDKPVEDCLRVLRSESPLRIGGVPASYTPASGGVALAMCACRAKGGRVVSPGPSPKYYGSISVSRHFCLHRSHCRTSRRPTGMNQRDALLYLPWPVTCIHGAGFEELRLEGAPAASAGSSVQVVADVI